MRQITRDDLAALSAAATASPRRRANLNIHEHLDDPVQRLAIAMEPDTLVLPHRHPHTWELLFPLQGRFVVLSFDDAGRVTERRTLGEQTALIETPPGQWHAVLSLDARGVIFEVKRGAYTPLTGADVRDWRQQDTPSQTRELLDWYARARTGDRFED